MLLFFLIVASLGSCSLTIHAQERPAVVELFTSQGCSSCPPADAFVGELAQRPDVLALTFHVDYWDQLGWRDRFGLPEAVLRQQGYAKAFHHSSVFTPQVVIDGQSSYVGSDRTAIGRALATARRGAAVTLSKNAQELLVDLEAQKNFPSADVLLFPYERSAVSPIKRGENSGRTLTEFNIVRAVRTIGQWDGRRERYSAVLSSFPADATDVAVIVQPKGQTPIIAAAAMSLR